MKTQKKYDELILELDISRMFLAEEEEEEEEAAASFVVSLKDVTEATKAEEEIRKARDELQAKVKDLERFNKVAVGRELKMVQLKKQIRELERQFAGK